jgi:hypothetical protein
MKKLIALLAGAMLTVAGSAWAVPTLTLSSGATTIIVADGSALDSNTDPNAVTYVGAVGTNWKINVSTGLFGTAAGAGIPQMDLNSVDSNATGTGAGSLKINFSGLTTGPWSGNGAIATIDGNSNVAGTATFTTKVNGAPVEVMPFTNIVSFHASDQFSFTPTGSDTVELIAEIFHSAKGSTSFDFALTPVPEPGTMLLLGAGFLGLAIYGKRRKNA